MCSGKTYVSNAASAAAPYQAQGALETTKQGLGNVFQYGVPETYTPDLQTINSQLRTQTELSDLINKEYERQSNPELYALRESLGAKAADVFNPDTAVTNELLKRGLISAKNTLGAAGNTGTGSTANQVMQKIYGPAYQQYKQQLFNDQNAYLDQNRRKAVMLDPSTAVSMTEGAKIGRVDAANMRKNQLLTGTSNASGNLQNYYSGLMNNIIGESGNSANAKTAASQKGFENMMSVAKLGLVEIPGTVAKFMPLGSSITIKENVKPFSKGYDLLKNLQVKSYDYKDLGKIGKNKIGLIAEEVPAELQVPFAEMPAVDLYSLVSITVSAVQDLQKKIESLEETLGAKNFKGE